MGGGIRESVVSLPSTEVEVRAGKLSEHVAQLESDFECQCAHNELLSAALRIEKQEHDNDKAVLMASYQELADCKKELESAKQSKPSNRWKKLAIALLVANLMDGLILSYGFFVEPLDKLVERAIMTLVNDTNKSQNEENQ